MNNTYCISYVSNSGIPVYNHTEEARSGLEAIQEIKGTEGVAMILSCVRIK